METATSFMLLSQSASLLVTRRPKRKKVGSLSDGGERPANVKPDFLELKDTFLSLPYWIDLVSHKWKLLILYRYYYPTAAICPFHFMFYVSFQKLNDLRETHLLSVCLPLRQSPMPSLWYQATVLGTGLAPPAVEGNDIMHSFIKYAQMQ